MVRPSIFLAAVATWLATQVAGQGCAGVRGNITPKMASGYRSSLIATGLRGPRHIVVDTAGNLLVAEQQGGNVRRLVLQDSGQDVCVSSTDTVVSGGNTNHGISLSKDGTKLFTSNMNSVFMYDYDASTGKVGSPKTLVTGMQFSTVHPTRAILVSKFDPDKILVAVGSSSNIDNIALQESGGRSMIKVFSIATTSAATANYNRDGKIVGWGLRNIVGIGEDPAYGGIWSVENSMDNVRFGGKDVHNENPAEKLNYHGALNDTNNALMGKNFGYPSCVAAWDASLLGGSYRPGQLFKAEGTPAFGGGDCSTATLPAAIFHSHTAPLDVKFTNNSSVAYIAFHGSWNRNPPDGYRVERVELKDGKPVANINSQTAGVPIMENPSTGRCPNGCFRPVGLDFDKKGRLFMSSDTTGEIYAIYGAA